MSTALSISYSHTIDNFSKGIDPSGPYLKVTYKIENWSQSDRFIQELMGLISLTGPVSGGTVSRRVPHQSPLAPTLFCISADVIEGLGNPVLNANGYPDYDGGALIRAEYRIPNFDFNGLTYPNNQIDPATPVLYCTQELDFASETFTISDAKYKYTDSGLDTNVPVKFSIPITVLTLTFHKLPYMPMTAVRLLRGRVNSVSFLGAAAGTVLFKGAKTTRDYSSDGTVVQKVQMTFEERDANYPWNSLPSQTSPVFTPVADSGGNKMYQTGDLNLLLFS